MGVEHERVWTANGPLTLFLWYWFQKSRPFQSQNHIVFCFCMQMASVEVKNAYLVTALDG